MPLVPAGSQRKAIRGAIVGLLNGSTRAGNRVHSNRKEAWDHALDGGELPAICVYTESETAVVFNEAPSIYRRTLRVAIECLVDQQDSKVGDDELDDFLNEVETVLMLAQDASGMASQSLYQEAAITEAEGERLILVGRLTFAYEYDTEVDELPVDARYASKLHVDWRGGIAAFTVDRDAVGEPLETENDGARAEDEITLP